MHISRRKPEAEDVVGVPRELSNGSDSFTGAIGTFEGDSRPADFGASSGIRLVTARLVPACGREAGRHGRQRDGYVLEIVRPKWAGPVIEIHVQLR
jgi:hypothetical protein